MNIIARPLLAAQGGVDREDRHTLVAYGGNNTAGPISVSTALTAHGGAGRMDFESETFVAHTLRGEGFDASEDGSGRGTPLVAVPFDTTQITSATNRSRPEPGDPCHPLVSSGHAPAIAYAQDKHHADAEKARAFETLRALREAVGAEAFRVWGLGGLERLHAPQVLRQDLHGAGVRCQAGEGRPGMDDSTSSRAQDLPAGPLRDLWESGPNGCSSQGRELAKQLAQQLGEAVPVMPFAGTQAARVRRLTPTEAERLMGFPDGYTAIQYRGKPAADGPRYKALGNSWAVNCARWIGRRIDLINALKATA